MTFASIIFLLFFSIVILLLSITNIQYVKVRLGGQVNLVRHVILLLSSYIFYGWWDWRFCFLMFFITLVAYWAGIFHKQKYIWLFWHYLNIIIFLLILYLICFLSTPQEHSILFFQLESHSILFKRSATLSMYIETRSAMRRVFYMLLYIFLFSHSLWQDLL